MARKDLRIRVKVIFTIDVGVEDDRIFAGTDKAEEITRYVFDKDFSRAHLLRIDCDELMVLPLKDS